MNGSIDETINTISSDEINISDILVRLAKGWLLILGITFIFAISSIILSLNITEKFEASAKLAPISMPIPDSSSLVSGGMGSLASNLLGTVGASVSEIDENLALLQSRLIIQGFIESENLLPVLYKDDWDSSSQKWTFTDKEDYPTSWKAYKDFMEDVLSISRDPKTNIITISITWEDPKLAHSWLLKLLASTNKTVKEKILERSNKSIHFLTEQVELAKNASVINVLSKVMQNEYARISFANSTDQIAFRYIDPPVTPEKRVWPKRGMIVIALTLLGGIFGCIVVLLMPAISKLRKQIKS